MGDGIYNIGNKEWTDRERIPWLGFGEHPKTGETIRIVGTIEVGKPPARFQPQLGDHYFDTTERMVKEYKGETLTESAKFPIVHSFRQEKFNGIHRP